MSKHFHMYENFCFRSSPCLDEYNGTDIFQIGLVVVSQKVAKMCENGAKKCLTASDFGDFPPPTQPNLIQRKES